MDLSLAREDCQHAVTDEALCTVTGGCALGTDVCHWMFKTKVNMVQRPKLILGGNPDMRSIWDFF